MKERLLNNLGLKLLAIFLAFFVWLMVVNISNPEVSRSKEVALEIENAGVLESADKTFEIIGKSTVSVTYDVRTADVASIKASDFKAYIDLTDLYDVTGAVPVTVDVLNNKDLISNVVAKPGVIRVETEDIQRKRFDLVAFTTGVPEDGYALGTVALSPESIYVSGPVSMIGQISQVGVEFSVDHAVVDQAGVTTPVLYDANGNKLSLGDRVTTNVPDISYDAKILKVKKLAVDFEVEGKVAEGYRLAGIESSEASISVVGSKSVLASVNTLVIPSSELNLQGITEDKTVTVELSQYLPPGVSLFGEEQKEIQITMKVEAMTDKKISLKAADITQLGGIQEYRYLIGPQVIEVTVHGLKEDLDKMKPSDLHASIDVSGMELGTNAGVLNFETGNEYQILSYTPPEVRVTHAVSIETTTVAETTVEETTIEPSEETTVETSTIEE